MKTGAHQHMSYLNNRKAPDKYLPYSEFFNFYNNYFNYHNNVSPIHFACPRAGKTLPVCGEKSKSPLVAGFWMMRCNRDPTWPGSHHDTAQESNTPSSRAHTLVPSAAASLWQLRIVMFFMPRSTMPI